MGCSNVIFAVPVSTGFASDPAVVFSFSAVVFFSGIIYSHPGKRLFDRDPQVTGDHYGARNLRLWQVILVWILAMDLLIMALFKL